MPVEVKAAELLNLKPRRRKVPGGAAGLQNQSGSRKTPGGFDSLPSPPQGHHTSDDEVVRIGGPRRVS